MSNIKTKTLLLASAAVVPNLIYAQRPNIILILADDMGYGDISAFNHDCGFRTPALDSLCSHGIMFTDAHSNSAVSTPTRYGIMTGRYAFRSTMKSGVLGGYSKPLIPSSRSTIADMLSSQGYSTACIGKWHLGLNWKYGEDGKVDFSQPVSDGPVDRGFDYFFGIAASLDMAPYVYIENDRPTALPNRTAKAIKGTKMQREGPQGSDFEHGECLQKFTEKAVYYINRQKDSEAPFFLYLPFTAPHTPILPSAEFQGKSGISDYCDFVLMVDAMVGHVVDAVKDAGILENTIIIFTTDNGCSPAAEIDKMKDLGHSPNYIFRGAKSDIYDGGHHIPLIVSWGSRYENEACGNLVSLTDFYATFADLCGYELKDDEAEDSFSFMNILRGGSKTPRKDMIQHSINGRFAIRDGKWKLVFWPGSGGWSSPREKDSVWASLPKFQLFNLEADPEEKSNLYGTHKRLERKLTDKFKKYISNGRSTPGLPQQNDEASEWKQIEFLYK